MSTQEESFDLFVTILMQIIKQAKVDRDEFLLKEFPGVDKKILLEEGPLAFYNIEELEIKANKILDSTTNSAAFRSFIAGLPANPVLATVLGTADAMQYFVSLLRLLQKIIYTLGEKNLFNKAGELSLHSQLKILGYIALMFSTEVVTAKILVGETGKQVTKVINSKISKKAVNSVATKVLAKTGSNVSSKAVSKYVPIIGGVISGGSTYLTFKKSGSTLITECVEIKRKQREN